MISSSKYGSCNLFVQRSVEVERGASPSFWAICNRRKLQGCQLFEEKGDKRVNHGDSASCGRAFIDNNLNCHRQKTPLRRAKKEERLNEEYFPNGMQPLRPLKEKRSQAGNGKKIVTGTIRKKIEEIGKAQVDGYDFVRTSSGDLRGELVRCQLTMEPTL